jgi:uncharacterized membrane protein HdeD (DUF308 family)
MLINTLARNWWAIGLRGLVAILFGIVAWVWPGMTLAILVTLFGIYAIVDGILAITAALSRAGRNQWGWLLFEGVLGILAGIIAFVWPGITALVLLYLIAAYALVIGIMEIVAAIELRNQITNEWFLALSGALSILFSILLVVWPESGLLSLIWLIGIYALIYGVSMLSLAYRLYRFHHRAGQTGGRLMA